MERYFATTHWTMVLSALKRGENIVSGTEAESAFEVLCQTYYEPVLRFIERTVSSSRRAFGHREARDITHDFFVRVLQGLEFRHLQRDRGRFRSYLLGAVKYFLADLRTSEQTQKRGGCETIISLEDEEIPSQNGLADTIFDRDWAETIVNNAIADLRKNAVASGSVSQFEVLRFWLTGDHGNREQAIEQLGVSAEYFKVIVSRIRKKFRENVRNQIAQTVEHESEIGAELDHLIRSLGTAHNEPHQNEPHVLKDREFDSR